MAADADQRVLGQRGYDSPMSIIKNALGVGAVVLAVILVLLLWSGVFNNFFSGKPTASDSFIPVAPIFTPAAEFSVGRGIGAVDAPVTLEVWTDFQCPVCGAWANGSEPLLYEKYITDGKLRIEHHFFAFLGEESFTAAVGAVCADKQNKFWSYHSYLFANQHGENEGGFSAPRLRILAGAAGLDLTQWDSCITDTTIRADVEAESAAARAAGVSGTPTLKLGDWMQAGIPAEADIYKRIDAALKP
jgi:protein-disulfide isomerase